MTTRSEIGYSSSSQQALNFTPLYVPAYGTTTPTPPPRQLASGSERGAPRCSRRRRLCARCASSRRARTHQPPAHRWSQRSQRENLSGSESERRHRPGGGRRRLGRCPRGGQSTSPPARAPFRAIPLSPLRLYSTRLPEHLQGVRNFTICVVSQFV